MRIEELQELFCTKISMEMERFKQRMLKQKPQNIYDKCYQIDSMINIYEQLMEMSQKMEEEALKLLLVFPNLLAFLYSRWLKTEDSTYEELNIFIWQNIAEISPENERKEIGIA